MERGLFQTPEPALSGMIEADIYELGGTTPTRVIRSDQAWEVRTEWKLCGALVPCLNDDDRWHLHVNVESMGPGPELSLYAGERKVGDYAEVDADGCYKYVFAKTFGEDVIEPPHEGAIFRVFVSLTYRLESGTPGPFAGFVELLPIQIFKVPED